MSSYLAANPSPSRRPPSPFHSQPPASSSPPPTKRLRRTARKRVVFPPPHVPSFTDLSSSSKPKEDVPMESSESVSLETSARLFAETIRVESDLATLPWRMRIVELERDVQLLRADLKTFYRFLKDPLKYPSPFPSSDDDSNEDKSDEDPEEDPSEGSFGVQL